MRSELRLSLSPHAVALVRLSGWRTRAMSAQWLPVAAPQPGEPPWMGAIAALPELFHVAGVRQGRATVVLSNHFVRYVVVPGGEALVTASERLDFARARLAQIHGDVARAWELRLGREPAGSSRLAAAIDPGLVDALRQALKIRSITLAACFPALTAMVDAMRTRIADEAWIVAAEIRRLVVARIRKGQWASVRVRPVQGNSVAIASLLAQERLLVPGTNDDCKVYVSESGDVAIDAEGVQAQVLGSAIRGNLAPEARVHATLALAGIR